MRALRAARGRTAERLGEVDALCVSVVERNFAVAPGARVQRRGRQAPSNFAMAERSRRQLRPERAGGLLIAETALCLQLVTDVEPSWGGCVGVHMVAIAKLSPATRRGREVRPGMPGARWVQTTSQGPEADAHGRTGTVLGPVGVGDARFADLPPGGLVPLRPSQMSTVHLRPQPPQPDPNPPNPTESDTIPFSTASLHAASASQNPPPSHSPTPSA